MMKPTHPNKESRRLKTAIAKEKEDDLFAVQPGYLNVTAVPQVLGNIIQNREKKKVKEVRKEPLKHGEYQVEERNRQKSMKNIHLPKEKNNRER